MWSISSLTVIADQTRSSLSGNLRSKAIVFRSTTVTISAAVDIAFGAFVNIWLLVALEGHYVLRRDTKRDNVLIVIPIAFREGAALLLSVVPY